MTALAPAWLYLGRASRVAPRSGSPPRRVRIHGRDVWLARTPSPDAEIRIAPAASSAVDDSVYYDYAVIGDMLWLNFVDVPHDAMRAYVPPPCTMYPEFFDPRRFRTVECSGTVVGVDAAALVAATVAWWPPPNDTNVEKRVHFPCTSSVRHGATLIWFSVLPIDARTCTLYVRMSWPRSSVI